MEEKMRLLWLNVVLMLVCITPLVIAGTGGDFGNKSKKMKREEQKKEFHKKLSDLTLLHFTKSLDYLFTGAEYANQKVEKPGMSKYLRELSDNHWKEGIDTMKKHFQRGGSSSVFDEHPFKVQGQGQYDNSMDTAYLLTLGELHEDSTSFARQFHKLHNVGDADWQHYFEEKLEEEEKRKREMKGHLTTLKQMSSSGLALHVFDSNL